MSTVSRRSAARDTAAHAGGGRIRSDPKSSLAGLNVEPRGEVSCADSAELILIIDEDRTRALVDGVG